LSIHVEIRKNNNYSKKEELTVFQLFKNAMSMKQEIAVEYSM
jgi:hypothetical protein